MKKRILPVIVVGLAYWAGYLHGILKAVDAFMKQLDSRRKPARKVSR